MSASTLLVFLVIAVSALVTVEGTQNEEEIAAWRESVCGYVTLVGRRSSQLKDLVNQYRINTTPFTLSDAANVVTCADLYDEMRKYEAILVKISSALREYNQTFYTSGQAQTVQTRTRMQNFTRLLTSVATNVNQAVDTLSENVYERDLSEAMAEINSYTMPTNADGFYMLTAFVADKLTSLMNQWEDTCQDGITSVC